MKTPENLEAVYRKQNKNRPLTPAQKRRIRKAKNRLLGYEEFCIGDFTEVGPPGALFPEEQHALIKKLASQGDFHD